MKLPLSVIIGRRLYGKQCSVCKKIRTTEEVRLKLLHMVVSHARYCDVCMGNGVELGIEVDLEDFEQRKKENRKKVQISQQFENERAAQIGGRAQPGSGGTRISGYKGDIRKHGEWRVEHKYTDSLKGWMLKLEYLAKIVGLAMDANENPALIIDFRNARESFAILPFALFLEMIDVVDKHKSPAERKRRRGR